MMRCVPVLLEIISIHAPRVGSDDGQHLCSRQHQHFNPRSPCGERRADRVVRPYRCDFNPRSPCGERRRRAGAENGVQLISIHAPRVGSD